MNNTPFDELCSRLYQFPPNASASNLNPLSNLYFNDGLFIVEGKIWSSVLQYLYYYKFLYDVEMTNTIVSTNNTKQLMIDCDVGMPSFKKMIWDGFRVAVLKRAMYAKFEQNIQLYIMLMNMTDSALNSIVDTIDNMAFELNTVQFLFEIRNYFKENGHPLVDTQSGEYRPRIREIIKKYKSKVREPRADQLSSSV